MCPCHPEDTGQERMSGRTAHPPRQFSSVQLLRAAETRWPAQSKQRTQSQFTFSDISVILHHSHTDWCPPFRLLVTASLTKCKPFLTLWLPVHRSVSDGFNFVSLRKELHHVHCEGGKQRKIFIYSMMCLCVRDKKGQSISPLSHLDERSDPFPSHPLWIES